MRRPAPPSSADPSNLAPSSVTWASSIPVAFTGANAVSVADADDAFVTTTLTTDVGALTIGATSAAVVVSDSGATTTIGGSPAAVNAALAGLTLTTPGGASREIATLYLDDGHLDHAYAATAHALQGASVDDQA